MRSMLINRPRIRTIWWLLIMLVAAFTLSGCQTPSPATTPTTTPPPATYTQYQLEYILFNKFPDVFWSDADFYPVAREGQEQVNALEQFPTIRANAPEFSAILEHLDLPDKSEYTDQEKLLIYREHKKLTRAIQVTPSGNAYDFTLLVGEGQGERITGIIALTGEITILKREPSFNTHPICLSQGTFIDTPDGPTAVEQLRPGMLVWTIDSSGRRVAAPIIQTNAVPVPVFQMVRLTLDDGLQTETSGRGRSITVSPRHPSAGGKSLADYRVGDTLDGGRIISVEQVTYEGGFTYDLLPEGTTGLYWANGILLKSTL